MEERVVSYEIIIRKERGKEGVFAAYAPRLGIWRLGRTMEESIVNMIIAMEEEIKRSVKEKKMTQAEEIKSWEEEELFKVENRNVAWC